MATWDLSNDLPKIGHPMPNAGSLCYLYVVRLRDVDSVPDPTPGAVTATPIQTVTGASIATYRFDPDTVRLRDQQRNSGQGPYFELTLEGFRSGIDNAHRHEITKLAPGYYICVWRNVDGQIRQLGSLERPMRFSASLDSGASDQDEVGADWQFTGIQVGDPVFMDPESPIPNIINNPCDAITSANFTVTWNIDGDRKLTSISIVAVSGISSMSYPLSVGVTPADGSRTWIYIRTGTNTYTPFGAGPNYVNVPGTYTLNAILGYTLAGGTECSKTFHFPLINTDTGQPPTVSLGAVDSNGVRVTDGDSRQTPLRLTFFAGASDPDGDVVEYRWDFDGDGTIDLVTTTPSVSYTYTSGGTQTPTVTVVDNSGNAASDSVTLDIYIGATPDPPPEATDANFGAEPQAGSADRGPVVMTPQASYSSGAGVPEGTSTWEAYLYNDKLGTTGKTLAGSGVKGDTLSLNAVTVGASTTAKWIQLEWVPVDANGLQGPLVKSIIYPLLLDSFIEFTTAATGFDVVSGPSSYLQIDFGDGAGFEVFDVSSNPTTISKTGLSANPKTVRIRGRAGANPLLKVVDAGISSVQWSDDFFLVDGNEMNLSGNQIDVQTALADLLPLIPTGLSGFAELALYGNTMPASPYPDSMLQDAVALYNLAVRVRADWFQLSTGGL